MGELDIAVDRIKEDEIWRQALGRTVADDAGDLRYIGHCNCSEKDAEITLASLPCFRVGSTPTSVAMSRGLLRKYPSHRSMTPICCGSLFGQDQKYKNVGIRR